MFNEFIKINKNIQQCKQNSLLILHTFCHLQSYISPKLITLLNSQNWHTRKIMKPKCAIATLNTMFDSINEIKLSIPRLQGGDTDLWWCSWCSSRRRSCPDWAGSCPSHPPHWYTVWGDQTGIKLAITVEPHIFIGLKFCCF